MEQTAWAQHTGPSTAPPAEHTINAPPSCQGIERELSTQQYPGFSVADQCVGDCDNGSTGRVNSEEHSNHSDIIPGVEHVFFETALEKMEQQAHESQVVVLAADNSEPSDIAFKFYADNVNRPGYVLHIVHHSNYWGNYEPMDGGPSPKHCQELMVKEDAKVREIELKYKQLMADNNIAGEFIVLRGKDAWHDIIQHQEKVKAIMIVMGTRGQNTLRRTFMGSVSDSVVHHASCPVLVCCHPKH